MIFTTTLLAAAAALTTTTVTAAPLTERATPNTFALAINGTGFDPNDLQTFQLSYANDSAWLGQIKYQTYSEPLIVSGAGVNGLGDGLSFTSIHADPNGGQAAYIIPDETLPIGFSTPHSSPGAGVRTTGWSVAADGTLLNNGLDLFYACQNVEQSELHSYQIWWWGAGEPNGVSCKGPLQIKKIDACT